MSQNVVPAVKLNVHSELSNHLRKFGFNCFSLTILRSEHYWVSTCPGHHQERGSNARPIGHRRFFRGMLLPSTPPPSPAFDQGNDPLVHPPRQAFGGINHTYVPLTRPVQPLTKETTLWFIRPDRPLVEQPQSLNLTFQKRPTVRDDLFIWMLL
jgi:hypothetical protein